MKNYSDPKTGEQYGAPFNEEDYDDGTENAFPLLPQSLDDQEQPMPCRVVEMSSNADPLDIDGILLDELVEFLSSPLMDSVNAEVFLGSFSKLGVQFKISYILCDIVLFISSQNYSSNVYKNAKEASSVNPEEIFSDLEKHFSQAVISGNIYEHNSIREIDLDPMFSELDSEGYLELNDFFFMLVANHRHPCLAIKVTCLMHSLR